METGIKVGDIMTRNFIYVSPETDLRECAKTMVKKRVGSLIIKEDDKLRGILTEKDIVWAVVKKTKHGLEDILVKDLMKRKVITIKPSVDIIEAMNKFKKKKIRKLPVVENGKLIGLLTEKDILKIDPGLFQMIAETIKIREETEKLNRKIMNTSRKQGICEECGEFDILMKDNNQMICEECYNKR
ncbi:MAG: CBS domain-containing protein [Candidatus Pacearchaeota archaeon]